MNPKDDLHEIAINLTKDLSPFRIVSSEAVLTELLNDFSRNSKLKEIASEFIYKVGNNHNVNIIVQTSEDKKEALKKYSNFTDKKWGLTDCISFTIMERTRIRKALAYDQHFIQAGYRALMKEYENNRYRFKL